MNIPINKRVLNICCILLLAITPIKQSLAVDDPSSQIDSAAAKILVFGGSGRLGSDVVKALVSEGHSVTVFVRETSKRIRLKDVAVDYVIGDVLDAASVASAFSAKAYDVAIDALGRGKAGVEFYRTSAQNIAAGAKANKLQQLILHGSVGAGNSASAYSASVTPSSLSTLMAAKTAGEEAVASSGAKYTIIRNSHLLAYGTPASGNASLYDDPGATGSVTRIGLARLTASCILNSDCYDKIFHAIDKSLDSH